MAAWSRSDFPAPTTRVFRNGARPALRLAGQQPCQGDELSTFFTDSLQIGAGLNVPANSYEIDIYDLNRTLLKTFRLGRPNGLILDSWDLTDANGNVIVNSPLLCDYSVGDSSSSASADAASPQSGIGYEAHYRQGLHRCPQRRFLRTSNRVISDNVVTVLRLRGRLQLLSTTTCCRQAQQSLLRQFIYLIPTTKL